MGLGDGWAKENEIVEKRRNNNVFMYVVLAKRVKKMC